MLFFRIFQHVLPNAKAWRLTADKQLRQFFEGLTDLGADTKTFLDEIWLDIFPATTRELDAWEEQWALPDTVLTTQQRRDRLDAAWKTLGGQSPRYLQDTLQNAGFNVFIHEWWVPLNAYFGECGQALALCGEPLMECGQIVAVLHPTDPVARDPFTVLSEGPALFVLSCDAAKAICGGVSAVCGATTSASGKLLVNKPRSIVYTIPTDEADWPFMLYFGGPNFGDIAQVQLARREEFEELCLKICPAQQWIGLIVEFN